MAMISSSRTRSFVICASRVVRRSSSIRLGFSCFAMARGIFRELRIVGIPRHDKELFNLFVRRCVEELPLAKGCLSA